ncbi:uncharacterized protein BDZ99DRAFT_192033 [Mytilinidion resinicola]|uniref:Uncharacterized protein n=1 Tax=Mytilinidion resinicola TaxID=574789 RepID=A0A6A6Z2Z9_9PEZI|nr:uncharacterized protein BDZ99DRAFT_192033 [Mytilinidion resinicola]KAF2815198.1 hypothetical protein BDZ99DRAFT_192033 [Mytilinidion resinicola]
MPPARDPAGCARRSHSTSPTRALSTAQMFSRGSATRALICPVLTRSNGRARKPPITHPRPPPNGLNKQPPYHTTAPPAPCEPNTTLLDSPAGSTASTPLYLLATAHIARARSGVVWDDSLYRASRR